MERIKLITPSTHAVEQGTETDGDLRFLQGKGT